MESGRTDFWKPDTVGRIEQTDNSALELLTDPGKTDGSKSDTLDKTGQIDYSS